MTASRGRAWVVSVLVLVVGCQGDGPVEPVRTEVALKGGTTLRACNFVPRTPAPIVIIDGVPVAAADVDLDPSTVELQILRGDNAAAYTDDRRQGVVIVTTKD